MRAIVFTGVGGPEVIEVRTLENPEPRDNEIIVEVSFAGLNPADVAQRSGRYAAPPGSPRDIPGLEVAGSVQRCGPSVTAWRVGDRVFGIVGGGGLASHVAVHERHVCSVPDSLDARGSAAVPEAFITAHDAVISQAGLRPGETLLVHGAAGGVGTAACQLGAALGARVFACIRSPGAAELVTALGATPIPEESFSEVVRGHGGADVILELVGAPHMSGNLDALAPKGRIAIVSTAAGVESTVSLNILMTKRASIRGTVLRSRPVEEKALAVRAFEQEVVPLLASGELHPVVDSIFPVDQAVAAFARLEGHGKQGKVLVEFTESTES